MRVRETGNVGRNAVKLCSAACAQLAGEAVEFALASARELQQLSAMQPRRSLRLRRGEQLLRSVCAQGDCVRLSDRLIVGASASLRLSVDVSVCLTVCLLVCPLARTVVRIRRNVSVVATAAPAALCCRRLT